MAGLFQGLRNFFFGSQDDDEQQNSIDDTMQQQGQKTDAATRGRPRGFQAKRQRAGNSPPAPVLQDALLSPGGVQGLDWYARSLRRDSDGELAHESLTEGPDGKLVMQGGGPAAGGGGAGCRVVDVQGGTVTVQPRGQAPPQQQQQ